jgi:hypothetical protein
MSEDHFIYVITVNDPAHPAGPCKIGISGDVGLRLKNLQTASPYPIAVVHTFSAPTKDIARDLERSFHHVLRHHRTSGEWFNLHPFAALQHMCTCIRSGLAVNTRLAGAELDAALEMCGVKAAESKLQGWPREIDRRKAYRARAAIKPTCSLVNAEPQGTA